jgi:DNA polymerase-3 subunit beta
MAGAERKGGGFKAVNFTCPKRVFHEALQSVSRAVASRTTLPILSNVLLQAEGGQLRLVTTDLEIGMTCIVPIEGGEDGAVTVPERILQDVVGNLPNADITISSDDRNMVTVASAKSRYTIHGLPADEFPVLPQVPAGTVLTIPAPTLRDLVRKTLFASSTDEGRVILTGCMLSWDGEVAIMVATDTHRLAVKRATVAGNFTAPVSVIIPSRALQELLRLINGDDPVNVHIGESQLLFEVGRVRLVTRLIEGQFPAFERVIPAGTDKRMVANRQQFHDAVRRASIVARAESNKIILRSTDSTLTITAETGEVGKAYEEIPITLDGEPVEIAFNAEYLLDVFGVLDTETVELGLTGPLNPGLLRAEGEGDYQYVVMPMQML